MSSGDSVNLKYLTKQQLTFNFDYHSVKPLSSDSYNETELKNFVDDKTDEEKIELFSIALQFSIIGQSHQQGGSVKIDDTELEVDDLIEKFDIKVENSLNDKLEDVDMTPKRLARLFRYEISNYINETGDISFLSKKYGDGDFESETFPCAEYMIDNIESANHLLNVYKNVDSILNTQFALRVERVFKSRKIFR